jgi:hypothetical protein
VTLLVGGFDAQLKKASEPPMAKRIKVRIRRGLKTPAFEACLVRMVWILSERGWTGTKVYSEPSTDWMPYILVIKEIPLLRENDARAAVGRRLRP